MLCVLSGSGNICGEGSRINADFWRMGIEALQGTLEASVRTKSFKLHQKIRFYFIFKLFWLKYKKWQGRAFRMLWVFLKLLPVWSLMSTWEDKPWYYISFNSQNLQQCSTPLIIHWITSLDYVISLEWDMKSVPSDSDRNAIIQPELTLITLLIVCSA